MRKPNRFVSAFSRARDVLAGLFFEKNDAKAAKAARRRKRRELRLKRRTRPSVPVEKSATPRPPPIKKPLPPRPERPQSQIPAHKPPEPPDYEDGSLVVRNQNIEFLKDPRFLAAYERGMNSGHHFGNYVTRLEWRAHTGCWAAVHAKRLPGDFVECGVNTGILSLAVCEYIDFNATGKKFWLFDTFAGIPQSQVSKREAFRVRWENERNFYPDCWELAQQNFASYPNAHLIRGMVPESLPQAPIEKVCYLSIDMNIAAPERAAIEYFWPKLVTGAIVILDDYGWRGFEAQKATMDEFAAQMGTEVLALPTGQGLIIKA